MNTPSTAPAAPAESNAAAFGSFFEAQAMRFSEVFESWRGSKASPQVAQCTLDFFGCDMATLARVIASPEAQALVTVKCHHCERMLETTKINSAFVACDECIERHTYKEKMKRYRAFWEATVPERYRETDLNHADFPKAIWEELKATDTANPGGSYFLFGPTGTGKSRLAVLLLKQALLRDQHIGILWPEKLSTLKSSWETTTFDKYAAYDVLLFDDTLLAACREAKLVEVLKQLVDVRMRHNRPIIVTSQIGEAGVVSGKEYGDAKEADIERIGALIRRLREYCKVIPMAKVIPAEGQEIF